MSEVRCWRCNQKLLVNEDARGWIVVKCDRCKALNRVELCAPLDNTSRVAAHYGSTTT